MENKKPLRILLADDHRVLRKGFSLLLSSEADFVVVAEASDGEEALQKAREVPIDIALLDLSMPGMGGIECLRCLKEQQPDMRVLVLTMHSERRTYTRASRRGRTATSARIRSTPNSSARFGPSRRAAAI